MITERVDQTYRSAPASNWNINSSLSISMWEIFWNICSFLFDKWTAIWLICRRLFLERAWSGLMTFLREKWNNHSIFLWCRDRGPKCFLLLWQNLKWQKISIWKCEKKCQLQIVTFLPFGYTPAMFLSLTLCKI